MGYLKTAGALAVVASACVLASCLVPAPEWDDPALQGDYYDGDEEHRPGQPCNRCHGDYFSLPPLPPWEVAGTVYGRIDDHEDDGVEGVEVMVTDAAGNEMAVLTNRVGNFMVEVDSGVGAPSDEGKGVLKVPQALEFPLEVKIRLGDVEREMETKIWREGSCAHCHGAAPSASSVGRIYLYDDGEGPQ